MTQRGTTTPSYDVEINNGTDGSNTLVGIKGSNPNASALELNNSLGHTYLLASWGSSAGNQMPDNFSIHDSTSGGHRFVIRGDNGFIGIGVDHPTERLQVAGNILASGTITPSDRRFKTNVADLEGALARVLKLRGVEFDWRRDEFPERCFSVARQVGFIAQEVQEIVPEIVAKGTDGYLSLDYAKLTPLLVEAIRAQEQELTELRRANTELDRKVTRLESVEARLRHVEGAMAASAGPR